MSISFCSRKECLSSQKKPRLHGNTVTHPPPPPPPPHPGKKQGRRSAVGWCGRTAEAAPLRPPEALRPQGTRAAQARPPRRRLAAAVARSDRRRKLEWRNGEDSHMLHVAMHRRDHDNFPPSDFVEPCAAFRGERQPAHCRAVAAPRSTKGHSGRPKNEASGCRHLREPAFGVGQQNGASAQTGAGDQQGRTDSGGLTTCMFHDRDATRTAEVRAHHRCDTRSPMHAAPPHESLSVRKTTHDAPCCVSMRGAWRCRQHGVSMARPKAKNATLGPFRKGGGGGGGGGGAGGATPQPSHDLCRAPPPPDPPRLPA